MLRQVEMTVRSVLRRTGLAGPIIRVLARSSDKRRAELRQTYERTKPREATVQVLGKSARLRVENAEEYAHYLAEPEKVIMGVVFDNINPGDTVWDVGANIGLYTLLIGAAVGPKGTVLAFEPMPWCNKRLRENIALNAMSHVQAMDVALGRKRERLFMKAGSSGLEGDIRVVRDAGEDAPSVEVIPGDELRRERGLAVPALVKIDVQAAEEDVILGLAQTLKDPGCRTVICEIHYAIFASYGDPDAPIRIERHLRDMGFVTIKRLDRNHIGAWKS